MKNSKLFKVNSGEVLTREQLKNVVGGLDQVPQKELCRIMWYDASGTYQETDILSNSSGANQNCVNKISAGAIRCWYDCDGDGWGN